MSEKNFAREFCLLTRRLHPVRIENALSTPGLPDVSLSVGFCELKALKSYPKRETTPITIDHYTDHQRQWLIKRWNAGGGAWLALRIRTDWFIFNAPAAQQVGHLTKQELLNTATAFFLKKPVAEDLCQVFIDDLQHHQSCLFARGSTKRLGREPVP